MGEKHTEKSVKNPLCNVSQSKRNGYLCSMIELSRHIESLLLKHDCVIVPGLGGFVTQYVPARRIADEQLFLPPCRSVGFNSELAINDGLLAQSYMHAYDSTYPESLKLIDDAVAQLKEELAEKGEYMLHGIGLLKLGVNGQYNFEPCEAGVISPELYGLDSLSLPVLTQSQTDEPSAENNTSTKNKIKQLKPRLKRTEKDYTISLNRELVTYVAAAVVAMFFYFIWATPVGNSSKMEQQNAAVISEQLFAPIVNAARTTDAPAQKETEAAKAKEAELEGTTPAAPVAPASSGKAEEKVTLAAGKYTIVLASAIPQGNARELTAQLKKQGLADAKIYLRGRMVRVIYGAYATQQEAQLQLRKLRDNEAFDQAWVMEVQ